MPTLADDASGSGRHAIRTWSGYERDQVSKDEPGASSYGEEARLKVTKETAVARSIERASEGKFEPRAREAADDKNFDKVKDIFG